MKISKPNMLASNSRFLYMKLIILLSCCNLQALNLLGVATAITVVRGNDTDQQALLQFKAKITGDQLRVMESWNTSSHFCKWHGVTCSHKHQRVTELELQFFELSGSLSPYIGNLSFLMVLDLEGNSFNKQIPREFGRLRRLESLNLSNNSLTGEIPWNLSACSELRFVGMRGNQLTGEIPASLGLLSNVRLMFLGHNRLRGSIPPSLGNLSSLEGLALMANALSGIIPETFGKLSNLSELQIEENAISGVVPVSMYNLSNIRAFNIGGNRIQGTLPSDFAITMPNVEFFSVWGNQITGQIPVSISNASVMSELQLGDNRLSGNMPSLEKLDQLSILLIDRNHLGHGEEGDLNFLCTLVNKTKLEILDISKNNLGGLFPKCITNFSTTLSYLIIESNKMVAEIPEGIGNLINLEALAASKNRLSGPIPFDIGSLHKLKLFYAHSNFLSGPIPHSIGNLTVLIELALDFNNLQGTIPSSLGNCHNLLLMDLSNNNLSGPIPPQVLELSSMSIALDLSSNYLTGELPVEVEKMKNLGEFYVSQNNLSGLLPSSLGNCISLEKLFLDENSFEGHIPLSFRSLRGLVELDVSDNNLSGEVPEFLVNFRSLQYLNLSFNDFEGVVPNEGVFKNISATFVDGNDRLCGGIPELHLSICNSKTSSNTSHRLKLVLVLVFVILGVILVCSFLLIIWFRKKKQQQPTPTCTEHSLLQLSYTSILRATDGFCSKNLLGSGGFGSVYKGILEESGVTIAVKVFNLLNHEASRSFLTECEALKNIRHRNLVKVLTAISGVDYQGNDFKALIYEFMANGSLEDWLHRYSDMNKPEMTRNMYFFQRVNVAIDVAHALEYLHHRCETPVIHCDLKPSNILLDNEMVGHISDFGLAKILSVDKLIYSAYQSSSLGLRGTIGYAPPEYGMGGKLSTKGDVYSYGILLLEMFTGKRPTHDMFKEGFSIHNYVAEALPDRTIEIIDPVLLQERAAQETLSDITFSDRHLQHLNSIFVIGLTCSAESPTERMDMIEIVSKLCSIRDKILNPTRFHIEHQT